MKRENITTIAIMTNSCTVLAAAEFPLYLVDYRGRCTRWDRTSDINKEVPLPGGPVLETKLINILKNPREAKMTSVDKIITAQKRGDDIKFGKMLPAWLEEDKDPHYGVLDSVHSSKTRTVESNYETTIHESIDYVKKNAIKNGINPPFLRNSYLVMKSIDGLSMDFWEQDYLTRLIGTQFYNPRNPLNDGLYTLIEYGITKRDVPEYRVVKKFGADS